MRFIDWAVLAAFVVPTTVLAAVWATRDWQDRSHLWSGLPGGWWRVALYWTRALLILVVAIAVSVAAAVGVQYLAN